MFFYFQCASPPPPFLYLCLVWFDLAWCVKWKKKISDDDRVLGKILQGHHQPFPLLLGGGCERWLLARSHRVALLFVTAMTWVPRLCWSPHETWFYLGKPVSVPVLETLLSRAISADVHKNQIEKKTRSSNSALISCSTTFSNPSNMSMNETWTWSEFCFLWDMAFPGEVACGTWWGPFLAATLPWGRGQCQGGSKAAVHLPDVRAENFLELFPRFKFLLGPNYWESDRSTDTENVCPSETGCLQLCRRWKFWKTKPMDAKLERL